MSKQIELEDYGWYSNKVHWSYEVGLWKKIKRGWEVCSSYTRFKVRDGSKIRF